MQCVVDFLDTLGIDTGPVSPDADAVELRYWREFADLVVNRDHEGGKGNVKSRALFQTLLDRASSSASALGFDSNTAKLTFRLSAVEYIARSFDSENAELAFYREAFGKYLTSEQMDSVVVGELMYPRFDHGL